MSKRAIKYLYIFTIFSPVYAVVNIYMFTVFSIHISENQGLWGDYFLMYFSLSLAIFSLLLAFINFKIRSEIGGIWEKLSVLNLLFLIVLNFILIASIFYSFQL